MYQSVARHRRTQSSINRQSRQPIEIVVTSPASDSFPLSPVYPPISSENLSPHGTSRYDSSEQDEAQGTANARGRGGIDWKIVLVGLLALVSLAEVYDYGKKRIGNYRETERIFQAEEQERRNLVRREVAAKLFENTTFYPSPHSSTTPIRVASSSDTPSTPRSYLFPIRIAEQESKGQQHLHQLALLAISLNRTLVLPNVAGSRFHSCHLFPFEFHYDVDEWVERYEGKLSVIGQEEWLQDLEREGLNYRTTSIEIMEGKKAHQPAQKEEEPRLDFSDFCLSRFSGSFQPVEPPISPFYAPYRYNEFDDLALAGFSNGLVSSLSRFSPSSIPSASQTIPITDSTIPNDVLFIDYNLRYPIFPTFLPNSTDLTPPPLPPASSTLANQTDHDFVDDDLLEEEALAEEDSPVQEVALYNPFPFLEPLASSSSPSSASHPFLSFKPLPYSPLWTSLANSISHYLSPFVAVHWRMESVPSSHLVSCASSLAHTLDSLLTESIPPPLRTIYLASDYSFDSIVSSSSSSSNQSSPSPRGGRGTTPHSLSLSDTFIDLTSSHRAAANRLVHLLRPSPSLLSWFFPSFLSTPRAPPQLFTLTSLLSSTPSLLPPELSEALEPLDGDLFALDSGLKGILDKLVLTRADQFVAGSSERGQGMCAKGSSFTESVVSQRRKKQKEKEGEEDNKDMEGGDGGNDEVAQEEEEKQEDEESKDIVRWFRRPGR